MTSVIFLLKTEKHDCMGIVTVLDLKKLHERLESQVKNTHITVGEFF